MSQDVPARRALTARRVQSLVAVATAVTVGALVAACGTSAAPGGSGADGGTTLTLYSAQHAQTTDRLVAAFTRETGIKVRVESNGEDVLTAQLEQEGARSPADVFYAENSNWLEQLDRRGMFAPVHKSTLADVPAVDSGADGRWVGVSARVTVIVYDPAKVSASELPSSVRDLAQPRWKGRIEIAPAETDFWPVVVSVAHSQGTAAAVAWLDGLKANAGSGANVPDDETLASDVNQGITSLAVINHYYYYRLRAEIGGSALKARVATFAPGDPGYVQDISGAAILRSSTHQAAAQRFLAFLTSQQGQQLMAGGDSYEYPIRAGVPANPALPPLPTLHPADFTPADLGTGVQAKQLLQQVGLL
jgi:iron(III) transport system substrate-binding protein